MLTRNGRGNGLICYSEGPYAINKALADCFEVQSLKVYAHFNDVTAATINDVSHFLGKRANDSTDSGV